MLQALGGAAATLSFASAVSAHDEIDDDVIEYTPDENQRPEGPLGDGEEVSYSRFSDQVTDGTYVVVDEVNINTDTVGYKPTNEFADPYPRIRSRSYSRQYEEGGFMSVHIARPEENIADVGFIDPETGEPQEAAATIIGYSEHLEPGVHQNVHVPIFEDEDLQAVTGDLDKLEEPTVLVSLPHVDSNENEEWDFFDEGDEDPAYGFEDIGAPTDGSFAPPGPERPTDIAAVVPLEENAEDFHIFRPADEFHDGRMDSDGKVVDEDDKDKDDKDEDKDD